MSIPTIFGFPLWRGKIKKRVAKKYLANSMLRRSKLFRSTTVGDYVNDCTGRNGKIITIEPIYRRIGKGVGAFLIDLDIQTENTGCSFLSCGVEPKLSREVIEARHLSFLQNWTKGDGGRTWYGADTAAYDQALARANKAITALTSGEHIFDEDGKYLPGFENSNRL
jgi:hypothetical protein